MGMMLHRHFDAVEQEAVKHTKKVEREDYVCEIFPSAETDEQPKRRGRPRKTEE